MKKINDEKFMLDYEKLVAEKTAILDRRQMVFEQESRKVDAIIANNGYPVAIKESLLKTVFAPKEAEFDTSTLDEKIAFFENYIEEIPDFVEEEPATEACEDIAIEEAPAEVDGIVNVDETQIGEDIAVGETPNENGEQII